MKSGGLHLIAVGEVLQHLTSRCNAGQVQSKPARILPLSQVGVGIPSGGEAIFHSVASLQNNSTRALHSSGGLLNSISRDVMFQRLEHVLL